MSDMFQKGMAYRKINVHRSGISAYYEPLDRFPIAQSLQVCSLLSGVYNHSQPQPSYTFIWDVKKVLCYLKSLLAQKSLSDKELRLKFTMMLALTATSRCSETSY